MNIEGISILVKNSDTENPYLEASVIAYENASFPSGATAQRHETISVTRIPLDIKNRMLQTLSDISVLHGLDNTVISNLITLFSETP